MIKKIKAFTLVELIIVMAILAILMSALMNFYKPIRETYVDSSMIENMRTTQDGILEYITENVRYAEYMMIFDDGAKYKYSYDYTDPVDNTKTLTASGTIDVDSVEDAYKAFCIKYGMIEDNAYAKPDKVKYESTLKNVHVIVINRENGYDKNGIYQGKSSDGYSGRIITNIIDAEKFDDLAKAHFTAELFGTSYGDRTVSGYSAPSNPEYYAKGDFSYMALGGAYYGASDYAIYIDKSSSWSSDGKYTGSLTFCVENALKNEGGIIKNGKTYGNTTVTEKGGEVTLTSQKAALTKNLGDIDYYTGDNKKIGDLSAPEPAGSVTKTGNITSGNTNTYIIFTNPSETGR